jgi:tRNA pseudouridine55 synthase
LTTGILLLDKPIGMSSNAALQRVRRMLNASKAGHVGSLDPLATGMLPICLGEATKIAGDLLDGAKAYEFVLQFGERRSTGDREGEVVERCDVPADLGRALEALLPRFRGPLMQVPPLYSALKHQGEPLYRLARRGEDVERAARPVTIESLELLALGAEAATFAVRCSKGTYVRTLGEDLAVAAGSCGHLAALRRTAVAPFEGHPMLALEVLQAASDPAAMLVGADAALPHLPALTLTDAQFERLRQGQRLRLQTVGAPGRVRAYDAAGRFRGVAEFLSDGVLHPRRLFNDLGSPRA